MNARTVCGYHVFNCAFTLTGAYMRDTARTLDRAADGADVPRATQYSYRGGEVSPDLRVEARILDESGDVAGTVGRGDSGAKGLIGRAFEDYLTDTLGGNGSFSVGGREFDGGVGNRWWEAKSGNFWNLLKENPKKLEKFKSDMGHRLQIATENGATYELFSNTPIPDSIKQWLTKKGISYTELY